MTDESPIVPSLSPWSDAPRNSAARTWRERCNEAIQIITETSQPNIHRGSVEAFSELRSIKKLVNATFLKNTPNTGADRTDLIRWIGQVCAVSDPTLWVDESSRIKQGGRFISTWIGKNTAERCAASMIRRWTMSAWANVRADDHPTWATDLLKNIYGDPVFYSGSDIHWKKIPKDLTNETPTTSLNAQLDFLIFLQSYETQAKNQAIHLGETDLKTEKFRTIQMISKCCLALRIMEAISDKVDHRILECMKTFEIQQDYSMIDPEILCLAAASSDLKILNSVAAEQAENQVVAAVGRSRKM